jgi:hypothetical protein
MAQVPDRAVMASETSVEARLILQETLAGYPASATNSDSIAAVIA